MKKFKLDTRSISLLGVFVCTCAVVLLKILVEARAFGALPASFYRDFFAFCVGVALIVIALTATGLCAKKEDISPLKYYKTAMPGLAVLLLAGYSVCQLFIRFGADIVWANVLNALGYNDFSPVFPSPTGLGIANSALVSVILPAIGAPLVSCGLAGRALSGAQKRTQTVLSAFVFAFFAQSFDSFGSAFVTGIFIYSIYYATGSIIAPAVTLLVNNLGDLLFATLGWGNALHALMVTPLGIGISIALAFILISCSVGIIRMCERRCTRPYSDTTQCAQNAVLSRFLELSTLALIALTTAFYFVSGVLV